MATGYLYEENFIVRDYECDFAGVVNNANYLHYLEHARFEFMNSAGINVTTLFNEGIIPLVTKVELDYKSPLKSRDLFVVKTNVQREGKLRFSFLQDIYRLPDQQIILRGKTTGVCIQNNRPIVPDKFIDVLEKYNIG